MDFKLKLEITDDSGQTTLTDLITLSRTDLSPENLGLQLSETHQLLEALQKQMMTTQLQGFLAGKKHCQDCGKTLHSKGRHQKVLRTLFGDFKVSSPRLKRCSCSLQTRKTFSPLADLLPEKMTPELWFMESKWAALAAYGVATQMIKEAFPVGKKLNKITLRRHTLKLARQCEARALPEESLLDGTSERARKAMPLPNGPLMVGLDGGYVRKTGKQGWFEVITGKSHLQFTRDPAASLPPVRCFAFVQGVGATSKHRLLGVLKTQGVQPNQTITFVSDGGDSLRQIQRNFSPTSEHILDWFHLTMRFTVLKATVRGLPVFDPKTTSLTAEELDLRITRVKHYLWHGNTVVALEELGDLVLDLESLDQLSDPLKRFLALVKELQTYAFRNQKFMVNYGERYRNKEEISSAFVESTVNWVISKRFCKKQQMGWTVLGAHLLLQIRTQVLNEELEDTFRTWYPAFHQPGQAS